jgi:hypothetical protein
MFVNSERSDEMIARSKGVFQAEVHTCARSCSPVLYDEVLVSSE